MYLFSLLLSFLLFSSSMVYGKESLIEKQYRKRQSRLNNNEKRHETYFRKKEEGLKKKYQARLKRLEKRRKENPLKQKRYRRIQKNIEKWHARENKQLDYRKRKFLERSERKRSQLAQSQP